jgi:hypothetical protein
LFEYELTDGIRVFAEGWYANSRGNQLRDQPVYNTGLFDVAGAPDGPLILSVDNPFLSPQARAIIQAQADGDTFLLNRANTDLITGESSGAVEIYRGVLGFDGSFTGLGGRDWNWEIVGNYGRS